MTETIEVSNKEPGTLVEKILYDQKDVEILFAAAAFISPAVALETCGFLSPRELTNISVRRFWSVLREKGPDANIEAATQAGILDELLREGDVINSYDVDQYARSISSYAYLFRVGESLTTLVRAIGERRIEEVRRLISELAEESPQTAPGGIAAVDGFLSLFDLYNDPGDRLLPTGFPPFDLATGGFEKETYNILAARPGKGKTTLVLQFAAAQAAGGLRVLFASQEMSTTQVLGKMASSRAGLEWVRILKKQITPEERDRLDRSTSELMNRIEDRLIIVDTPGLTTFQLWDSIARLKPDIVYQDHLALMGDSGEKEVYRQGYISGRGKSIAKWFGIPVVFIHQLNRGVEARPDKEPTLADLRDSGKHEEHADNVYLIHPEPQAGGFFNQKIPTKIIIAKNRMGPPGIILAQFDKTFQRYERSA